MKAGNFNLSGCTYSEVFSTRITCSNCHEVTVNTQPVQTNQPTPWSRVILEKLTVTQPIMKFLAFYATQRFIIVFTRVHHWSLTWARWIQFTHSHLIP